MSAEVLNTLKKILGKYQKDVGIVVWGVDESGTPRKILVKPDGTVIVEGIVTVSGEVDVTDRWSRQLGQVDIARYLGSAIGLANPLHSQIVYGGAVVDPRQIRALTAGDIVTVDNLLNPHPVTATDLDIRNLSKLFDEVYAVLRTDAGVAYDARDRNWTITETLNVGNPPNLDVALSTRASESKLEAVRALLDSLENALASVGTDKLLASVVGALPAGTNTIGNVNAVKSGTWNIDNLFNPHPISLTPESKLVDANQYSGTYAPTAAGNTTIITAVTGKVIRVYDFSLWNSGSADVTVELYFGTSGKRLYKGLLAAKTGVLKTYVRPWESNSGDSLVLALSAAGTCDYCIGAVQA